MSVIHILIVNLTIGAWCYLKHNIYSGAFDTSNLPEKQEICLSSKAYIPIFINL